MVKSIRIIEEAKGDIWGNEVMAFVDEKDRIRELRIYKVMKKYAKRKCEIVENGVKLKKTLDDKILEFERNKGGVGETVRRGT